MARKYFNWKLAVTLLLGLFVLGLTAYGLRKYQRSNRADRGIVVGQQAYEQGEWEKAAKHLGRYLSLVKDDVPVLLKYADAQLNIRPLEQDNIRQAISAYRNALRQDKKNSEAANRLARLYLQLGMPGEAELITRRQLETGRDPNEKKQTAKQVKPDPELCRILAVAMARQQKFDQAYSYLKKHIDRQPDDVLAYELLAQLAEQQPEDSVNQPEVWLNKCIQNNPSSPLAYIIRAGFFAKKDEQSKAEADLEQAEKLNPSGNQARLRIAREFLKLNLPDRAQTYLEQVYREKPKNQDLWNLWYELARKSGSPERMSNIAQKSLDALSPDVWDLMPMAAELLIRSGNYEKARECVEKLNRKEIAPGQTAFLEGLLASNTGDPHKASKSFRTAIEKGHSSPKIHLMLASTLSQLGNHQKALQQLRNLVSRRPDMLQARLALARMLDENGLLEEAAEQARMARQISPDSLKARLLYNQARLRLISRTTSTENAALLAELERNLEALPEAAKQSVSVKLQQVQLHIHKENYTEAEKLINRLEQSYPSNLQVKLQHANLMYIRDKKAQAESILSNAIKKFPQQTEPVSYLTLLLANRQDYKKCEQLVNHAMQRINDPIEQRELALLLSRIFLRTNQQKKAYELLTRLAGKLPGDIPLKCELLKCKQVTDNPEKAQKLVDEIKNLEGEDGRQWRYEQAKLWYETAPFEQYKNRIISLLKDNLLDNPSDQQSRMLLAFTHQRAGEMHLAVSTFQEALERSPRNLRVIVPAVAALYKVNDYDSAEKIINRAARLDLDSPELQKLQLQNRLRQGDLDSAGSIMEKMLVQEPDNRSVSLSLALLKSKQEKFEEASILLDRMKEENPDYFPVIAAQVQLKLRQNKTADAVSLCDQRIEKEKTAQSYILRARTYSSLGKPEKALQDFSRAIETEPNNTSAWLSRSSFFRSKGELKKASEDLDTAMKLAPDRLDIRKSAIPVFFASNNPERIKQAEDLLAETLQEYPEDTQLNLYKARTLLSENTAPSTREAVTILDDITQKQPGNIDACLMLGRIILDRNKPTKAMETAIRGLVRHPENTKLLMLKARAERATSPALSVPTLKTLRELDPGNLEITNLLADSYLETDKGEKAISLLKEQLSSAGNPHGKRRLRIALAEAYYKTGRIQQSREEFDRLYNNAPDDPEPLLAQTSLLKADEKWNTIEQNARKWSREHPDDANTLVTVAARLAQTNSEQAHRIAETLLRDTLQQKSDSSAALMNLAMLLLTKGRENEAVNYYKKLLEIQPDNVVAMNNLAWILCSVQGNYKEALKLAQRGLKQDPDYTDLIDTRGVIYYRLGQFEKAVRDFTRCLKLYPPGSPSVAATHFHLGQALEKLGQQNKAQENLKKALELNEKFGGLSQADAAETQKLIKKLSERSEI